LHLQWECLVGMSLRENTMQTRRCSRPRYIVTGSTYPAQHIQISHLYAAASF
jgi:hypothetical protein